MDLESKDADDLSYAFAGNEDGDSGLAAALGVNTFFTGTKTSNISVNDVLSGTDLLASGILDTPNLRELAVRVITPMPWPWPTPVMTAC